MGKIQQLPEHIAIKIAAGEVVERPASVIKELVENALDAGATNIDVTLQDGGKTLIEVKDDGSGMDKDDAVKAFLRHGTSKIRAIEDLHNVTTLGFRGEALAAIAASAEVNLVTAERDASRGTEVRIRHGGEVLVKPHAPLVGTTIAISNLFVTLPARQKFLKSDITEWKASLEVLIKQMIANPGVGFIIRHNNRVVYDLPSDQQFRQRVGAVWKVETGQLISLNEEIPHMSLHGVLAKPEIAHDGKARQFFAVNGHPVNDKMVGKAIRDGFGTLLPPAMQPSFALNLTIHPGMVDVNIHPRKDEVRFVNPPEIFRLVLAATSRALDGLNLAFATLPEQLAPGPSFPMEERVVAPSQEFNLQEVDKSHIVRNLPPAPMAPRTFVARSATFNHVPLRSMLESVALSDRLQEPILTLDACYLITIHEGKLLLVDQHAAHERILYNKLWQQDDEKAVVRQSLLIPAELKLSEEERLAWGERRREFEAIGFTFTDESDGEVYLLEVPQLLKQHDPVGFFHSLLKGLDEDRPDLEANDFKHKLFATMACKAAIKLGDIVSEAEKRQLIADLMSTPTRFTCPHGRPSHIEISVGELEKLFKRAGF